MEAGAPLAPHPWHLHLTCETWSTRVSRCSITRCTARITYKQIVLFCPSHTTRLSALYCTYILLVVVAIKAQRPFHKDAGIAEKSIEKSSERLQDSLPLLVELILRDEPIGKALLELHQPLL